MRAAEGADTPTGSPVPPVAAASILLVRDSPQGLEVLLQDRDPNTRFAGGATVFPGGKVDGRDLEARDRARGVDGLAPEACALRLAAIRELFEECGILLARGAGEEDLLGGERTLALATEHRAELESGRLGLAALADLERLELAADRLVPFAQWITPEPLPRRFDTYFFLAALPADQEPRDETSESVRLHWATPAFALAEAAAGRCAMMFPTRMNLAKLGRSRSVEQALASARRARVVPVLPRLERGEGGGRVLRIPAEADYDLVEIPLDGLPHG